MAVYFRINACGEITPATESEFDEALQAGLETDVDYDEDSGEVPMVAETDWATTVSAGDYDRLVKLY